MKTSFLKLFIPLLVAFLGKVGAQEQSCMFTHYSLDDGLSQNTVMSMAQDSKGVMCFATWNGLNRFDGRASIIIRYSGAILRDSPTAASTIFVWTAMTVSGVRHTAVMPVFSIL